MWSILVNLSLFFVLLSLQRIFVGFFLEQNSRKCFSNSAEVTWFVFYVSHFFVLVFVAICCQNVQWHSEHTRIMFHLKLKLSAATGFWDSFSFIYHIHTLCFSELNLRELF